MALRTTYARYLSSNNTFDIYQPKATQSSFSIPADDSSGQGYEIPIDIPTINELIDSRVRAVLTSMGITSGSGNVISAPVLNSNTLNGTADTYLYDGTGPTHLGTDNLTLGKHIKVVHIANQNSHVPSITIATTQHDGTQLNYIVPPGGSVTLCNTGYGVYLEGHGCNIETLQN
jgi:hypothetical protein